MTPEQIASLLPNGELDDGSHDEPGSDLNENGELCLMEAVAYITGEKHSDHPKCACPDLTSIGIGFNDSHSGDKYELRELIKGIPALVGSRTGSSRVRWKRAKKMVKLLMPRFIEEAHEYVNESASKSLLQELEVLSDFRNRDEAKRALKIVKMIGPDVSHDVTTTLENSLEALIKRWNSDGISKQAYGMVIPSDLQEIFTSGEAQADVLSELGHIRS